MTEHMQKEEKKENKNWRVLLLLLLLLLLISIGITVWTLFFRAPTTLAPDYAPREKEQYAEDIGDTGDEKLEQQEGGGSVSLTYTMEVTSVCRIKRLPCTSPIRPSPIRIWFCKLWCRIP